MMKKVFLLLMVATPAWAQTPHCLSSQRFAELASRPVATLDEYRTFEADFLAAIASDPEVKKPRFPTSIPMGLTDETVSARVEGIKTVAQSRVDVACNGH